MGGYSKGNQLVRREGFQSHILSLCYTHCVCIVYAFNKREWGTTHRLGRDRQDIQFELPQGFSLDQLCNKTQKKQKRLFSTPLGRKSIAKGEKSNSETVITCKAQCHRSCSECQAFLFEGCPRKGRVGMQFREENRFVDPIISSFCFYAKKIVSHVPSHSTFVLRSFSSIVTTTNFLSKCLHYPGIYFRNQQKLLGREKRI